MNANNPENKIHITQQELVHILEVREQERQRLIAINKRDSLPVLTDLAEAGFHLEWIEDLYSKQLNYKDAIPILLRWLPQIDNLAVKEGIVRALSVSWAKPVAAQPLIIEFRKLRNESNTGIKWAIANALSVVADDSVYTEILNLVQDPGHGSARQMLAISLGSMKNPAAQDVLIDLLSEDEVAGHAIMALGKLRSTKARTAIERFLTHPKSWVRREAKKAIARIDKSKGE